MGLSSNQGTPAIIMAVSENFRATARLPLLLFNTRLDGPKARWAQLQLYSELDQRSLHT
jgi:hypothetical protein